MGISKEHLLEGSETHAGGDEALGQVQGYLAHEKQPPTIWP